MATSIKPLVHWAIYKGYKLRYTDRSPTLVSGKLTTESGLVDFDYDPDALCIRFADHTIFINSFGWELSQDAQEGRP